MTRLMVRPDDNPSGLLLDTDDPVRIARTLAVLGVGYERVSLRPLRADDPPDSVLAAYQDDVARWMSLGGYRAADVVSVQPDHPHRAGLRLKFLDEHVHDDDEVRFFASGVGVFGLHLGSEVHELRCAAGDWIRVPAGTPHWFDMGADPSFVAIRLFTSPEGWVARSTGSTLASRFSRVEASP